MNYARNYQNLLKFVKVMPKILVVPFFSRHGVMSGGWSVHLWTAEQCWYYCRQTAGIKEPMSSDWDFSGG